MAAVIPRNTCQLSSPTFCLEIADVSVELTLVLHPSVQALLQFNCNFPPNLFFLECQPEFEAPLQAHPSPRQRVTIDLDECA